MGLKDLRAEWAADPTFAAEYKAEYPYEAAAEAIAELRGNLGLSQTELAALIGSTQSVIARAESGQHAFQISLFQRIADATGTWWIPAFSLEPPIEVTLSYFDEYPLDLSASVEFAYTLSASAAPDAFAIPPVARPREREAPVEPALRELPKAA